MFEGLLQPVHLLIILGIALLVFGPSRLPELGKGLGKSLKDFKDTVDGAGDKLMKEVGVSPEEARKMNQSLQSVRRGNLQKTLADKAMEHTGLKELTEKPAAAASPVPPVSDGEAAAPAPANPVAVTDAATTEVRGE